jgi:hypothetical protein
MENKWQKKQLYRPGFLIDARSYKKRKRFGCS